MHISICTSQASVPENRCPRSDQNHIRISPPFLKSPLQCSCQVGVFPTLIVCPFPSMHTWVRDCPWFSETGLWWWSAHPCLCITCCKFSLCTFSPYCYFWSIQFDNLGNKSPSTSSKETIESPCPSSQHGQEVRLVGLGGRGWESLGPAVLPPVTAFWI